jgi:type IV fimbrial biogenesis protein FimT
VAGRTKGSGFTLIEMMVGLAILALLLLLGMPTFTTFVRNSEIRSTAESLVNGLRAASAEATRQNAHVIFTLTTAGSSSWAINVVQDPASNTDCATLVQPPVQSYAKKEAGASSTVATTPADKLTVCFNGLGRIINQGVLPSDHVQQIDVASVVVGEARPLRIIVDDPAPPVAGKPRGLRMCDPDPALAALVPPDPRAC